jgi:hypothetical protein
VPGKQRCWDYEGYVEDAKLFCRKAIIITGAASGIGRATALIFAREGANVVCADITVSMKSTI